MRIASFCFLLAASGGVVGMTLGIAMGLGGNFALAPAHAHVNLLGWVTMALYGLYHRGAGRRATALDWAQAGCGGVGYPLFAGGLAVYLATGREAVLPATIAGSLLCLAGIVLFLAVVLRDALPRAAARAAAAT